MELQNSVKLFLNNKHVVVPDDWVTACIDWVLSDNPRLNRENKRAVSEKVFEQWLYSDLTELGTCCLPLGLTQQRLTTITGYFAVQVNQVRNVGQPAYVQLQKVQKADTQNTSVSAEQPHQPAWEPKPTRMLLMQITDGTSVVHGMEYRTIPILSLNIKPGAKLLLFGNITSRRGTLLLGREQVEIMGGEVEALHIPNAMENVLARCLRLEENEHPREFEESIGPTQPGASQASQYYPSQMSTSHTRNYSTQQPTRQQPPPPQPAITNQTTAQITGVHTSSTAAQNLDEMEDEDFLDADMEAVLSQIEGQVSPSSHSGQNGSLNKPLHESSSSGCTHNDGNNRVNKNKSGNNNDPLDNSGMDTFIDDMDIDESIFTCDFDDTLTLPSGHQASSHQQSLDKHTSNISPQHCQTSSIQSPAQWSKQNTSLSSKTCNVNPTARSSKESTTPLAIVKPKTQLTNMHNFIQKLPGKDSLDQLTSNIPNRGESEKDTFENTLSRNTCTVQPGKSDNMMTRKIGLVNQRSISKRVQEEQPFTYLCFLPQTSSVTQEVVVKGFIMTLVSRMEQTGGRWCLRVLINDSTASREVDIASEVLEELIGFSVEELVRKKAEAKSNPELKARLAKSLSGCQQKLISLCCLLHLDVGPSLPRPILTALTPVTPTHMYQLLLRSSIDTE
ncbi:hypothetical protein Pcinc_007050 [Petrolisthes cinctipes]|uniref:RecQ-mediated genome instability protein 1 n=1 Tax=Petrolisthes cinctipes TaxID=88211 RepID=A0AAE1GBP3_PETCI|nr:hypothetical protein Pcinc_007050 [Petrolisthes cinctipes]